MRMDHDNSRKRPLDGDNDGGVTKKSNQGECKIPCLNISPMPTTCATSGKIIFLTFLCELVLFIRFLYAHFITLIAVALKALVVCPLVFLQ